MLRFESSQISWRRLTTRDTTLRGIDIPAGTQISLNFASANRQSDLFEDPDQFDIHRPNASQHISFGEGMQYCLGANLAKFEAVLVLEALTERLPSLHMVQGQPIWSSPNIIFRGPEQFIVDWNPADGTSA